MLNLFKPRFTKDDLLEYTGTIVDLVAERLKDKLSLEDLYTELKITVEMFFVKYGKE